MIVVTNVCCALTRIGVHHFQMVMPMTVGAGRMKSGIENNRAAPSHTTRMTAKTSHGRMRRNRRRRAAAATIAWSRLRSSSGRLPSAGCGRAVALDCMRHILLLTGAVDMLSQVVHHVLEVGGVGHVPHARPRQ